MRNLSTCLFRVFGAFRWKTELTEILSYNFEPNFRAIFSTHIFEPDFIKYFSSWNTQWRRTGVICGFGSWQFIWWRTDWWQADIFVDSQVTRRTNCFSLAWVTYWTTWIWNPKFKETISILYRPIHGLHGTVRTARSPGQNNLNRQKSRIFITSEIHS